MFGRSHEGFRAEQPSFIFGSREGSVLQIETSNRGIDRGRKGKGEG